MEFGHFYTYLIAEKRSSPHTLESYKNDLAQFEAYCHRNFEVENHSEVSHSLVRSWMASLMDEGYAISSIHRKLSSVRAYFKFLQKIEECDYNPARNIPKPKLPKRLPHFLDEKSAENLYRPEFYLKGDEANEGSHFQQQRDKVLMTLLYEAGLRRAEIIGLHDEDVDFYLGQIKVTGKRNKMRYVPVGKAMCDEIRNYMSLREKQLGDTLGILFVTDKGKKINNSFVYLKVKSYLSNATTLKKKSPHVLRHTFATHMLNNGADLNVIKEILGHSSLAATQVYTHNNIEKLKSIHQTMHPRNK